MHRRLSNLTAVAVSVEAILATGNSKRICSLEFLAGLYRLSEVRRYSKPMLVSAALTLSAKLVVLHILTKKATFSHLNLAIDWHFKIATFWCFKAATNSQMNVAAISPIGSQGIYNAYDVKQKKDPKVLFLAFNRKLLCYRFFCLWRFSAHRITTQFYIL